VGATNLSITNNKIENIITSTMNLSHQIYKLDVQKSIYPTFVDPNVTSENLRHSSMIYRNQIYLVRLAN
jgi:hypothetical protein